MAVENPKKAKTTLQVWDEKQLYAVLNKMEKYSIYLAVLIAVTTIIKDFSPLAFR